MAAQILDAVTFVLGEDKNLRITVTDADGASLASATATVGIVDSAGSETLAATAMTGSGTTERVFTYLLTTGAAQTITAAGEYRATYIVTYGSQNIYFEQIIRVVASVSLSTSYPDVDDIVTRLSEAGLTAPGNRTIKAYLDMAAEKWEELTGLSPFVATGSATHYFTPINRLPDGSALVDFSAKGVVFNAVTSFVTDGYYDSNGAYTGGSTLVSGRDYKLIRPKSDWPYTYAKVFMNLRGLEDSVKIVGTAGWSALPYSAFESVIQEVLAQVTYLQSGGQGALKREKQGPVEWEYATPSGQTIYSQMFYETARRYAIPRIA